MTTRELMREKLANFVVYVHVDMLDREHPEKRLQELRSTSDLVLISMLDDAVKLNRDALKSRDVSLLKGGIAEVHAIREHDVEEWKLDKFWRYIEFFEALISE